MNHYQKFSKIKLPNLIVQLLISILDNKQHIQVIEKKPQVFYPA